MHTYSFSLLYLLSALVVLAYGQINNNAAALPIAFASNSSMGPDGPWWYIPTSVDFPDQYMYLFPSLSNTTLIVNASACSSQSASCPLPLPALWYQSGADIVSNDTLTYSPLHAAAEWDSRYAALLNISGQGRFFSERLTLYANGDYSYVDAGGDILGTIMEISNGYEVMFPGGAGYTIDGGFFSLYGGQQIFSWEEEDSGFVWYNNLTLPDAYVEGFIPSTSYGIHVGSVYPNITGSLVLGGYDSSRCLTSPITTSEQYVELIAISLEVVSGGHAYTNTSRLPINNLLKVDGALVSKLEVYPDPGVPYLYLPQDTCDAIAAHLPVTYNADYNLYIWNSNSQSYKEIVSSPHFVSFTFSSGRGGGSSIINVPFALLNLTLETPIIDNSVQYFPCSPWKPDVAGYTLGRSFLQAAFLAQNWNTSTLFLAQAPGPDFLPANVKDIAVTDITLSPAVNPPSWESTWSSTLKPLSPNTGGGPNGSTTRPISSGLSGGDIAGIVVGVIVGVALIVGLIVIILIRSRRQKQDGWHSGGEHEELRPYYGGHTSAPPNYYDSPTQAEKMAGEHGGDVQPAPLVEAPDTAPNPVELDAYVPPQELETQQATKGQ